MLVAVAVAVEVLQPNDTSLKFVLPADAKPGDYAGAITVGAEGAAAVRVPPSVT